MPFDINVANVLRSCGAGKEKRVVLSSTVIAVITFFYFFVICTALQINVYTFQHRVTYERIFTDHITTEYGDIFIIILATIVWCYISIKSDYIRVATIGFLTIFLVLSYLNYPQAMMGAGLTLPIVIGIILIDRFRTNRTLNHEIRLSTNYISIITFGLTSLGILGLGIFILSGVTTAALEKYPYAIFQQILGTLAPLIMALLVFCLPFKVLLNLFINRAKGTIHSLLFYNIIPDKLSNKSIGLYLSLSIVLGITLTFLPHIYVTNPYHERLGVDTPRYTQWLDNIQNQTSNPIFFTLNSPGDRPLTLIVLLLIKESMKLNTFQAVEFSPVILISPLIIVTFFLTRQLTSNDKVSLLAAFLSSISFQSIVGIYSGFYANWLALILGYLGVGLIVRYLKKPSKFCAAALVVTMTGLLLAHVYTWTVMIAVAFVFLFVLLVLNYYPRKRILLVYLILSSSIAVDVLKSSWIGSSTGLEADVSLGRQGLGIGQFSERLKTLTDTVQIYYGGIYANIAILGLVLYWLIRCNPKDLASIFLLIFMSSAIVPLFMGDWVLQSRVLYEIPFQMPAAIGLFFIWKDNRKLIAIAIILVAAYLSFHVLVNLGLNYSVVG